MKQYELRDKHFEHQVQEKDLEKRLAEAKYAQVLIETARVVKFFPR